MRWFTPFARHSRSDEHHRQLAGKGQRRLLSENFYTNVWRSLKSEYLRVIPGKLAIASATRNPGHPGI